MTKRSWWSRKTAAAPSEWNLKPGQLIALILVGVVLLAQVVWATFGALAYERDRQAIFSQESALGSLNYTQRDSFNLRQKYDRWVRGEGAPHDVLVARAALGKRLNVVYGSGLTALSYVQSDYREALAELDYVLNELSELNDLSDGDGTRESFRSEHADTWDRFDVETRALSATFETRLAEDSAQNLALRTQTQGIYLSLAFLSVVLILGSLGSIGVDLRKRHRSTVILLKDETELLERSRETLILYGRLDYVDRAAVERENVGDDLDDICRRLVKDLQSLVPDNLLVNNDGQLSVEPRPHTGSETPLSGALATVVARGQLILDSLISQRQKDTLTGLSGRKRFTDVVYAWGLGGAGSHTRGLLVGVNVKHFGGLNAGLGMESGDSVLKEVAKRLTVSSGAEAHLARIAADEFNVFIPLGDNTDAEELLQGLFDAVQFRLELSGTDSPIHCSVGAVIWNPIETAPELALGQLAASLKSARASNDPYPVLFDPKQHLDIGEVWLNDLDIREAFRLQQFVIHYQPIVDLQTLRVVGCEALLRWNRPGVGLVYPGEIFPGLERVGLLSEVGLETIEQAFLAWKGPLRKAMPDELGYFSVNVDGIQFEDGNLAKLILMIATRTAVSPERLVVEVTEKDVFEGDNVISQLEELRAHGVRVALDDFGSGFSNFAQLAELPLDIIKLDRGFLHSFAGQSKAVDLVAEVNSMAERMGYAVIAEGIEDEATRQKLLDVGVRVGQGFLFAPGLPEGEFAAWARSETTDDGH